MKELIQWFLVLYTADGEYESLSNEVWERQRSKSFAKKCRKRERGLMRIIWSDIQRLIWEIEWPTNTWAPWVTGWRIRGFAELEHWLVTYRNFLTQSIRYSLIRSPMTVLSIYHRRKAALYYSPIRVEAMLKRAGHDQRRAARGARLPDRQSWLMDGINKDSKSPLSICYRWLLLPSRVLVVCPCWK